jgi:hypothetical protein
MEPIEAHIAVVGCDEDAENRADTSGTDPGKVSCDAHPIADLKLVWGLHTPPVPERQTIPALVGRVHTHQRRGKL